MTSPVRTAGLLLVLLLSTGCGPAQNAAQPASCGLNRTNETVQHQDETASIDGYEGTTLEAATALARSRGHILRVVGEDNTCHSVTDDFSFGRVNVYVDSGVVEAVEAF